jgi:N-acetylneuraminate synthase/N,N'-diacetyllegionaminate synthase
MKTAKNMSIGIGSKNPCFVIAEAGVNHNGDIKLAKKLIDEAKKAGADAVKFQTFKAKKIVTMRAKQAKYQTKNIGKTESQYEMLKKLELSYSDFDKLKVYCDKKKIVFLSTPHSSNEDVDLVARLCPAVKVGSGDLTNLPFLKYIAETKLPVILSTGMATLKEVKEAIETIIPINKQLIILHCTTNYPTPLREVNLREMLTMKRAFGLPIGYSDHTEGIHASLSAVALGAKVIEKHFTLNKSLSGPDHKASLEPNQLKEMIRGIREIEARLRRDEDPMEIIRQLDMEILLGSKVKKPTISELEIAVVARKSIVALKAIKKGVVITKDMLTIKRPGTGIKPKYFDKVVGKTAKIDIPEGELINWQDITK